MYQWGNELNAAEAKNRLHRYRNQSAALPQQGLSKGQMANIPTVIITNNQVDDEVKCSICLNEFKIGQNVRELPCDHKYHTRCINRWFRTNSMAAAVKTKQNITDQSTLMYQWGDDENAENQLHGRNQNQSATQPQEGLSKGQMAKIPTVTITNNQVDDGDKCTICLNNYIKRETCDNCTVTIDTIHVALISGFGQCQWLYGPFAAQ